MQKQNIYECISGVSSTIFKLPQKTNLKKFKKKKGWYVEIIDCSTDNMKCY